MDTYLPTRTLPVISAAPPAAMLVICRASWMCVCQSVYGGLCVFVCICIYTSTHIYIYIYKYIYMDIYEYIHNIYTQMLIYIHVYKYINLDM